MRVQRWEGVMREGRFTLNHFNAIWGATFAELYSNGVPMFADDEKLEFQEGWNQEQRWGVETIQKYVSAVRMPNSPNITGEKHSKNLQEGIFSTESRGTLYKLFKFYCNFKGYQLCTRSTFSDARKLSNIKLFV